MKNQWFVLTLLGASMLACQAPGGPTAETAASSGVKAGPSDQPGSINAPSRAAAGVSPSADSRSGDISRAEGGVARPSSSATPPGPRPEYATRHALFQPVGFETLPQWSTQSFAEALTAFKNGCAVLGKRPLWAGSCNEAEKILGNDSGTIKAFFEREFEPYRVLQKDRSDVGNLTGYFEPLLRGNRERKAPFVYPVYETPSDLLLLDGKELDAGIAIGDKARYVVDGREVKLIESKADVTPIGPRIYKMALNDQQAGTRDRKFRVRVEGQQIVSYPSRQDIERNPKLLARPIAWVESREALYAMQVQGSGRILFPNGSVIRVAYAEQNGHTFIPRVSASVSTPSVTTQKTRGMAISLSDAEAGRELVVGAGGKAALRSTINPARKGSNASGSSSSTTTGVAAAASERLGSGRAGLEQEAIGAGFYGSRFEAIKDPSYVFFREINSSSAGPMGAMGVHLTPGRSIAVDPRVTPLGTPVMIERGNGAVGNDGARLMVAQDTGGAIRGPVRADYFWGFGKSAANQALRTNDDLKMWILLPKAFKPSALVAVAGGPKTRSLSGSEMSECLMPDAEFCAE